MASPANDLDYSTLEVDVRAQNLNNYPEVAIPRDPEVNPQPYARENYPEPVCPLDYGEGKSDALADKVPAIAEPTICGLGRKIFWIVLAVAIVAVVGFIVGVTTGILLKRSPDRAEDGGTANSTTAGNDTSLSPRSRLAATNFTDGLGNENYIVVYQLSNKAIYMSTWNSSHRQWVISPVVDGTGKNGVSLDEILDGTSIGLDIYRLSASDRNMHLYWLSPAGLIKSLFLRTISTDEPTTVDDWEIPPANNKNVASPGSSLVSYGKQCVDGCPNWTYFFWQAEDSTLGGAELSLPTTNVWKGLPFDTSAYAPLSPDTSISLSYTLSANGTSSIDIFYRSDSGSLAVMNFDGDETFWGDNLPRDVSVNTSIVAFGMGSDDTPSNNPNPVVIQVLTVDHEAANGVQLTYYRDAWNRLQTEVTDLSDCTTVGSMAVNRAQRLYCLIEGGTGVELVEWVWKGDPRGDETMFLSWERVGTVDTTVA
ncbi:hypothetical protein F4809DRAFT_232884 [Biscogniauxia mediterranea]|nr:hypothetical protein F4809DRAFT_232884 [Biscogniauxia mediterranea]